MDEPRDSILPRSRRPPPLRPFNATGQNESVEAIPHTLEKRTTIDYAGKIITIEPDNIEVICQLGRGAYGVVEKVRHRESNIELALKRTQIEPEHKRIWMEIQPKSDCPYIVKFYGALFWEGDLWVFMEIMDSSLDKFYPRAYSISSLIPESVLGKISACVAKALHYLYEIKIIHRDVKPSNILINVTGQAKLCDFGISGYLVNSIAQTYEAGCKPYMAPERINPPKGKQGYGIKSDVWSFGITMLEVAIGRFPYPAAGNFFQQLSRVCNDDPPRLPPGRYSTNFEDFINKCLQKDYLKRPDYTTLLDHPFIKENGNHDISQYVSSVFGKTD